MSPDVEFNFDQNDMIIKLKSKNIKLWLINTNSDAFLLEKEFFRVFIHSPLRKFFL